jgi:hypothetical protein
MSCVPLQMNTSSSWARETYDGVNDVTLMNTAGRESQAA